MSNPRYQRIQEVVPGGAMTEGVPWEEARPGDLLSLDGPTRRRLEKMCCEGVESWLKSSGAHHANLRRWNDLLEGVIDEVDYPWEGASTLHIPLIAMHLVTLHSVMARSLLTVDPLWHLRTNDEAMKARVVEIEEGINYEVKSELNVVEACRDALYTTPRDGIGWLHGWWAHETSPVEEMIPFSSVKEFQNRYPDAESAKMKEEDYEDALENLKGASAEAPYNIRIQYERVDYHGPKFEVVDEADMVRAPMTATSLDGCRVYGRRQRERSAKYKEDAEAGRLWLSIVKGWCQSGKSGGGQEQEGDWLRALEDIEGVSRPGDAFTDERETFKLIVRFRLNKDDREIKVLCVYSHDKKKLLGASKYPYTKDCFFDFRIQRRPGRMIGKAFPEQLEDLNEGLDKSIRYEENCSILEQAPMFKGKKKLKNRDADFDPAVDANWFGPGKILWLDDPTDFTNFDVKQSSKRESKELRQELLRYAEMLMGPTQMLSGRESAADPNAPGNKTIALIQQSNMRIEDYLNEFRLGFDKVGDFIIELYRAFGKGEISYLGKGGEIKKLPMDALNGRGKMSAHGVTVNLSPEVEFAKAVQWWTLLQQEPMVGGNPMRRRELLSYLMVSGRLPNRDGLLPPKPEVEEAENKRRDQEAEKRVLADLIQKGIIPPPAPAPGMPPALPLPGPGAQGGGSVPPVGALPPIPVGAGAPGA